MTEYVRVQLPSGRWLRIRRLRLREIVHLAHSGLPVRRTQTGLPVRRTQTGLPVRRTCLCRARHGRQAQTGAAGRELLRMSISWWQRIRLRPVERFWAAEAIAAANRIEEAPHRRPTIERREPDPHWLEEIVDLLGSEYGWQPETILDLLVVEVQALLRKRAIRELRRQREAIGQAILSRADGRNLRRALGDLNLEIERMLPARMLERDSDPRKRAVEEQMHNTETRRPVCVHRTGRHGDES